MGKRKGPKRLSPGVREPYVDARFADLDEVLAKSRLTEAIYAVMRERKLTQLTAAALMGIDQPKVSRLLHSPAGGVSTDRLIAFLTALGRDVEIVVRPVRGLRKRGRLEVSLKSSS